MSNLVSLEKTRERHDALYAKVLQEGANLTGQSTKRRALIDEIDALLKDIQALSGTVDSFEQYRWLTDAAVKWQSVLSTTFEDPKIITLSKPNNAWLPIVPSEEFSETAIEEWLRRQAALIAYARRADGRIQDSNTPESNWHVAEVFLASEILDGRINFVSLITPKSYWRLENIWLKEVKLLMAYFKWEHSKRLFLDHDKDFFDASDHIRSMLVNKDIKARHSEFNRIKNYLQELYLDDDYKIPVPTKRSDHLNRLIRLKAYRIGEETKSEDSYKNWLQAETYVKMLYENIIPAVLYNDKESILTVLKSFQYSKMNRFIIINCFETALAIYLINPCIIQSLWDESAQKPTPDSTVESVIRVESWPQNFEICESLKGKFCYDKNSIRFYGLMSNNDKEILLKALRVAKPLTSRLEEYTKAIDKLHEQSRLIHKETTL